MQVFHEISNHCAITVVDSFDNHWEWTSHQQMPFDKALLVAEDIFAGEFVFPARDVKQILITDSNTGELLATCAPDADFDDNCNSWSYNEDCGFDPYLGCYTDDC